MAYQDVPTSLSAEEQSGQDAHRRLLVSSPSGTVGLVAQRGHLCPLQNQEAAAMHLAVHQGQVVLAFLGHGLVRVIAYFGFMGSRDQLRDQEVWTLLQPH